MNLSPLRLAIAAADREYFRTLGVFALCGHPGCDCACFEAWRAAHRNLMALEMAYFESLRNPVHEALLGDDRSPRDRSFAGELRNGEQLN